ncbi:DeoR/GlpR transcriptional regulator [Bacillaceae bacterium SIJ1]|uniref:DeoR family transcriptional regulator n=1 Tax=Litoribacterium kuwaitense TaxID=1398745 RepID=UPI0013EE073C|nr:DeoR family transcriptional regulator [Litoribacterium kuwaitense]NGP46110.1 DeoR/GlpR transcriptional regulator [Litoribacterium kuwaitense]
MLPIERRQKIMAWLEQETTLRVSDLSERLAVSEMTIYRDIRPLIDQGDVIKTPGGITLAQNHTPPDADGRSLCVVCMKETNTRLAMQLMYDDLHIEQACCAHCALLRASQTHGLTHLLGKDYLTDTTINGLQASYLIGSEARVQCCDPQVLLFDRMEEAQKFQRGFGGTLLPYSEAMHHFQSLVCQHSCQKSKKPF